MMNVIMEGCHCDCHNGAVNVNVIMEGCHYEGRS